MPRSIFEAVAENNKNGVAWISLDNDCRFALAFSATAFFVVSVLVFCRSAPGSGSAVPGLLSSLRSLHYMRPFNLRRRFFAPAPPCSICPGRKNEQAEK